MRLAKAKWAMLWTATFVAIACDRQGEARSTARTEVGAKAPSDAKVNSLAKPAPQPAVLAEAIPPSEPLPPAEDRPDEVPLPEEPAPPEPPADYGALKPSSPAPDPAALTVHAVAGYEVVAIHDKPDGESPKLGYLRLGTRVMVGAKQSGPGCPKGWHAVAQGGFACASKGLVVDADRPPVLKNPPPAAKLDQPLPYTYAYVKRWNSPMWWRVPTPDEVTAGEQLRTVREQERVAAEGGGAAKTPAAKPETKADAKPETKPETKTDAKPETKADAKADTNADAKADAKPAKDPASALPSVEDEPDAAPADAKTPAPTKAAPTKATPTEPKPTPAAPAAPVVEEPAFDPRTLPLKPEKSWLERGFYISVGEKVVEEGKTWWHTARGGYVDTAHAYQYDAKDFEGVPLPEGASFPFGFVMVETAKVFTLQPDGKLTSSGTLERRTFVDLDEEIELGGKAYMTTVDGTLLRKADLRMPDPQLLPKGLQPWERWVDVSLEKQILVAYEGEQPVFVSLVSTGKKGTSEEPFTTPTGRWRIRSKHVSTTMDGNTASDGNYSIQDVPWTMFFEGSFALHGAFWHQGFGRPRSHGCVNLGPSAARWLFGWTTPFLPEGWHGVHAHTGSPGTTVVVRQ